MNRTDENIYDINTYTNIELFNVLDLDNPTDRELEAKILFFINKYDNIKTDEGYKLASFFDKIYKHFFEVDEDYDNEYEENDTNITEGLDNMYPMNTDSSNDIIAYGSSQNEFTNDASSNFSLINASSANYDNTQNSINPLKNYVSQNPNLLQINTPSPQSGIASEPTTTQVGFTKSIDYAKDQLNPLLQQTITRVISIDSQYRDDKLTISTDFTFDLSQPLKDVVSLKLYSVQIPYTWYTINNDFGSNFFYIKGNSPGIADGNHDFQFRIASGNYSPNELALAVSTSIQNIKNENTDISFGSTNITYNNNTSLSTITIDIQNQFNETSYYLYFPQDNSSGWIDPYSSAVYSAGILTRQTSIPAYLGFDCINIPNQYPYILYSELLINFSASINNNNRIYYINSSNNTFIINKYIGTITTTINTNVNSSNVYISDNFTNPNIPIDLSFTISLSLPVDSSYTRNEIVEDLSNQIQNCKYLSSTYSGISLNIYNGNPYYTLAIKTNRKTTNNLPNSKLCIIFPTENSISNIWTGINSCFQFPNITSEINNIISETNPINEQDRTFIITTNPYIKLTCIKPGFDTTINDYKITIANSQGVGYTLDGYTNAINIGINLENALTKNSSNNNIGDFYLNYFKSYIDPTTSKFNIWVDITKNIQQPKFKMYNNGYINSNGNYSETGIVDISNINFLTTIGFADSYTSNDISNNNIIILSNTSTISTVSTFNIYSQYLTSFCYDVSSNSGTPIYYNVLSPLVPIKQIDSSGNIITTYQSPTNEQPYNATGYTDLANIINTQFATYTDSDGSHVLSNTNIKFDQSGNDQIITTLTIHINKTITQSDYSIQFIDVSYVTQNNFIMNLSGYYNNFNNSYSTIPKINYNNIGFLSNTVGLGKGTGQGTNQFSLSSNNVFTSTFDSSNGYIIDSSYLLLLQTNPNSEFNKVIYAIPSPTGNYHIPNSSLQNLKNLETDINKQINLFSDLSGTVITFTKNNTNTITCSLTIIITPNITNSSWHNLYIDPIMINEPYDLSNNNNLSYNNLSYIGIQGNYAFTNNQIYITSKNNTFQIIPFDNGLTTIPSNIYNNIITITIPPSEYTRTQLIAIINTEFGNNPLTVGSNASIITINGLQYTQIRLNINKMFTAKDYILDFYDQSSFVKCYVGATSVRNTTWDATLGWILGYRLTTIYILSDYIDTNTPIIKMVGDTGVCTNLFNYFLICLDDFNQNHLNDGLVTITNKDNSIPLPSYANRSNFICDPVTGLLSYNTNSSNYNQLTQNQIYSLTQIANSKNITTSNLYNQSVLMKSYGQGPFVKDVFGLIPMKLAGLSNGSSYVEFGGTLQNQERSYFGPVNISRMAIKLVSDRGDILDLNGANWSFSFICEQLYKQKPST